MLSNNHPDYNNKANELERFVVAHKEVYAGIIKELQDGNKRTHWMWFVFPQLAGLGNSPMAKRFALSSLADAGSRRDVNTLFSGKTRCTQNDIAGFCKYLYRGPCKHRGKPCGVPIEVMRHAPYRRLIMDSFGKVLFG